MEKRLIISPQAGFGNRLRVLCSGIVLAQLTGRTPTHFWVKDEVKSRHHNVNEMKSFNIQSLFDLNIPQFDGVQANTCYSEWLPGDGWYEEQSTAQRAIKFSRSEKLRDVTAVSINDEAIVGIETSLEVHLPHAVCFRSTLMSDVYQRYFTLRPEWRQIFVQIPDFDYGIAIRRGAFLEYFPQSSIDFDVAVNIINKLQGSKIIFSDDEMFAVRLRQATNSPFNICCEGSGVQGVENQIIQFLTLAKCREVFGTPGSSFPEQAALFGRKPFHDFVPEIIGTDLSLR